MAANCLQCGHTGWIKHYPECPSLRFKRQEKFMSHCAQCNTTTPLGMDGAQVHKSWCPLTRVDHVTVPAEKSQFAEKPSNPKDAFGVQKAPMSTVSAVVLAEVGVAMAEGAAKYGRHNYRAVGVRSSVYYDAAMRHLMAWWEGQDIDPDSGMPHIVKAITTLVVLRDAELYGQLNDDRPPRCEPFHDRLNAMTAEILARHSDKSPRHYTIQDTLEISAGKDHVCGSETVEGYALAPDEMRPIR